MHKDFGCQNGSKLAPTCDQTSILTWMGDLSKVVFWLQRGIDFSGPGGSSWEQTSTRNQSKKSNASWYRLVVVWPCAILCHLVLACAILCDFVQLCAGLCHLVRPHHFSDQGWWTSLAGSHFMHFCLVRFLVRRVHLVSVDQSRLSPLHISSVVGGLVRSCAILC